MWSIVEFDTNLYAGRKRFEIWRVWDWEMQSGIGWTNRGSPRKRKSELSKRLAILQGKA